MVTVKDNTAVINITKMVNRRIQNRILTPKNHRVLDVKPYVSHQRTDVNSVAVVEVDLYIDEPITAVPASDTTSIRKVYFNRMDLTEIAEFQGLPFLANGVINIKVKDITEVIAALSIPLDATELDYQLIGDKVVVSAPSDSLGYIGKVTFLSNAIVVKPSDVTATTTTPIPS